MNKKRLLALNSSTKTRVLDSPLSFSLLNYRETLSNKYYQKILAYDLILKQNLTTPMQLPRIEKIILNTTSKNYVNDKKNLITTLAALELVSGQKPRLTYARKSIANFKIRQHQILGCKVTLRENKMYFFLDKLSKIIFPRIRDYQQKTVSSQMDNLESSKKSVAYTIGFQNPMIFPELENHFELVDNFRGLNCSFIFLNSTSIMSLLLLSGFQLPNLNRNKI